MNKDIYLDCKKLLKEFLKKEYWSVFTAADLFYIASSKDRALFTFVDQFFGDSFGCQLFFNASGLNYVHDILTSQNEQTVTIYDCDSLCAAFVSKSELKDDEKDFLRKNNIRINEINNLIIYRYEAGFRQKIASDKDVKILFEYLELIHSILKNEYNEIVEWFKENESITAIMDKKLLEYQLIYRPLPYLEKMPKLSPANSGFIDEFNDCVYLNDECYLFTGYLPIIIEETNVRPLVVYFYFPKIKVHRFKYILDSPKEYKNIFYSILYEVFLETGIPFKISFNNRIIYSILKNTINKLNIESIFLREEGNVDSNMNEVLASIYQEGGVEMIQSKEIVIDIMEKLFNSLNDMSNFDMIEDDASMEDDLIS